MNSRIDHFPRGHAGGVGYRDEAVMPAVLMLVQLSVLLLLATLVAAAAWLDVPASAFVRDPAAIAGINPLNGLVSHLGAILWSATAGISLFTALLCASTEARGLFLYFGTFTVLLLLDDVFMLHEAVLPAVLGLPEPTLYLLYGAILLYGLLRYHRALRWRAAPLLGTACACFGFAAGLDILVESAADWAFWLEDGAKLLGIANWCAGFAVIAADTLRGGGVPPGGAA